MSRIRTIKPEFWTSEQVMECKAVTRLLFVGMWNFADDKGRMTLSPKKIKAQVFPGDDDVTSENVRRMIAELSAQGLVSLYSVNGTDFIQITGWAKHQRIDKPQPSSIPAPETGSPLGEVQVSETIPGTFAECSATEGKGMEGKGKEEDICAPVAKRPAARKPDLSKDFEEFYALYPRKKAREDAKKAFDKVRQTTDQQTILDGVNRLRGAGIEPQFIPYPASWLRGGQWADDYGTPAATNVVPINVPTFETPEQWAEQLRARHAGKAS